MIEVTVPESEFVSRCAVSPLEFGDMISYSFVAGHEAIIELTVSNPLSLFSSTKRTLKLKYLSLEPTLLATEREMYSHSARIVDDQSKIAYDIYFDTNGRPVMTRAYPKSR